MILLAGRPANATVGRPGTCGYEKNIGLGKTRVMKKMGNTGSTEWSCHVRPLGQIQRYSGPGNCFSSRSLAGGRYQGGSR